MIILAIETSCDDTAAAIMESGNGKGKKNIKVLSDVVSSQVKLHAKHGGVWPLLALREHKKNLPAVLKTALKEAKNPKFDFLAVTRGPGLEPCLWTGVNFANSLAQKTGTLIIPVNHIEAHICANFVAGLPAKKIFPAVCLIVSGGHTQLILMRNFGKYEILGETRDDAAGECFDKTARILGLGYPGGPAIAAAAINIKNQILPYGEPLATKIKNDNLRVKLPRPMIHQKNYDFSFSGLKTAVLYDFKKRSPKIRKSKEYVREMAREIQQSIVDVLVFKTRKAAADFAAKSIILGGGVAANDELRRRMETESSKLKMNLLAPPKNLCTDNAVMVGVAAFYNFFKNKKIGLKEVEADANLRIG